MTRCLLLTLMFLTVAPGQDWVARYSLGSESSEEAFALAVDPHGYSYVAGYAQGITVVKYSPGIIPGTR